MCPVFVCIVTILLVKVKRWRIYNIGLLIYLIVSEIKIPDGNWTFWLKFGGVEFFGWLPFSKYIKNNKAFFKKDYK